MIERISIRNSNVRLEVKCCTLRYLTKVKYAAGDLCHGTWGTSAFADA